MNERIEDMCEALDAAVFSGDRILYDPDTLEGFKEYIRRWVRAIKEHEQTEAAR